MTNPIPSPAQPEDQAFEDLLVEALELLDSEGAPGVERWLSTQPAKAPRLREHLERLHHMGLAGAGAAADGGGGDLPHPERLGDFRLLAALGQGGMGVVYRAVQESLGREVALKLIRPDQLFFPGARERFRREVELVARMQHPGIVPIYAVGSDAGVPYFVMELVHGATLADVILRLAKQPPQGIDGAALDRAIATCLGDTSPRPPAELFAGTWVQIVLRIVREVAEALEHAHRRGVLHRDVKPSNIMLTRDGRVLLLDFGLAGADTGERLTRTGSALGSLAYMPPELLSGTPTERSGSGDVYSLGVTCWELLALELPYQSSDPVKLRELAGDATRPRLSTRNSSVTWEVETVVATAMDPDPARRYASASALSRDLDNVLSHRPIEAREPGVLLRLRRWTQRHPARATAAVAAFLLAVGAPSLWAWQEARARVRIEEQRDELRTANLLLDKERGIAEAESQHARASFAKLQQAVDTMLTKVGDENLRDIPRMEVVRRDLLNEALRFYEGFLSERPDEPRLRLERARVQQRLAEVHALLGDYTKAGSEVAEAIAGMTAVGEMDATVRLDLARAHNRLATAHRLTGDLSGAAAAAQQAIVAWQEVEHEVEPGDAARGLGESRLEASLIAADRGDLAAALAEAELSLTEIATWQQGHPGAVGLAHLEARTLDRAAVWLSQLGRQSRDRAKGVALIERSIGMHERAHENWSGVLRDSSETQVRADAAQNRISLSLNLRLLSRVEECRSVIEEAVRLMVQLVADFPASKRRRSELANARSNYAAVLGILDAFAESIEQSGQATLLWQGLLNESPDNDEYAIGLAHSLQSQAVGRMMGLNDANGAKPLLADASAAVDKALAIRPDNPTYRRVRRKIGETLAELHLDLNEHVDAAACAEQLVDPAFAPTEPALAAALIARCGPMAKADSTLSEPEREQRAAALTLRAKELLASALTHGVTIVTLRQDPNMANQWDKPGFQELVVALEQAGH